MRSLRVAYRREAIEDLGEIYRYVAQRSQDRVIARNFVRRIKARCSKIGLVPNTTRRLVGRFADRAI